MLWGKDVAKDLKHYGVLDYCQYNVPGYRKRARIAHSDNLCWAPRPLCNPKRSSEIIILCIPFSDTIDDMTGIIESYWEEEDIGHFTWPL